VKKLKLLLLGRNPPDTQYYTKKPRGTPRPRHTFNLVPARAPPSPIPLVYRNMDRDTERKRSDIVSVTTNKERKKLRVRRNSREYETVRENRRAREKERKSVTERETMCERVKERARERERNQVCARETKRERNYV